MTEETMNKYPEEVTPIELPKKQGATVYTQGYVDNLNERIAELEEISRRLESYYQNQVAQIAELEEENKKLQESLVYERSERLRLRNELYKKCYPEEYYLIF